MEMSLEVIEAGSIGANAIIYYNGNDGVVVDPGGDGDKIAGYIKDNGIRISKILFTHGHFDHIGGADDFRKLIEAPAMICEYEREMTQNPGQNGSLALLKRGVTARIDDTFTDGQVLEFDGFRLMVIHTPGHTAGSCCFYDRKNGVLITGDTLFRQSIGRTDLYSGSFSEIIDSIKNRIFTLPDATDVYPGHGPKTTVSYEKRENPFVK